MSEIPLYPGVNALTAEDVREGHVMLAAHFRFGVEGCAPIP